MSQQYWDLYYIADGLGQIIIFIIIPIILVSIPMRFIKKL